MIILRCSWSVLAGVALRTFLNRSTVASGPMPPSIPTIFSFNRFHSPLTEYLPRKHHYLYSLTLSLPMSTLSTPWPGQASQILPGRQISCYEANPFLISLPAAGHRQASVNIMPSTAPLERWPPPQSPWKSGRPWLRILAWRSHHQPLSDGLSPCRH